MSNTSMRRFMTKNEQTVKAENRTYAARNRDEWAKLGIVSYTCKIPLEVKPELICMIDLAKADYLVSLAEGTETDMETMMVIAGRNLPKNLNDRMVDRWAELCVDGEHADHAKEMRDRFTYARSKQQIYMKDARDEEDPELTAIITAKAVAYAYVAKAAQRYVRLIMDKTVQASAAMAEVEAKLEAEGEAGIWAGADMSKVSGEDQFE